MKHKIIQWIKRYGLAELIGLIGAISGGLITNYFSHNAVLTALGGTWGENIGYYGTVIQGDLNNLKTKHKKITFGIVIKLVRNLIIEFGPGEYLDSFIIRPLFMYQFPLILHNLPLGLFVAKYFADLVFYIPTIVFHELRKKYLND